MSSENDTKIKNVMRLVHQKGVVTAAYLRRQGVSYQSMLKYRQSELVVRCIPSMAEESCFAHVATFRRLVADINAALTREDRERLVAFTALEADADVFGIPGRNASAAGNATTAIATFRAPRRLRPKPMKSSGGPGNEMKTIAIFAVVPNFASGVKGRI